MSGNGYTYKIKILGKKDIPHGTQLRILKLCEQTPTQKEQWRVSMQFPGQTSFTDFGVLDLSDGLLVLPVKLVFRCHAKDDAHFVRDLSQRFYQAGILSWFDEKDLLPGDDWKRRIDEAIECSEYVLVCISSVSCTKEGYVQREIRYALERSQLKPNGRRYIIPLLIDENCQIPQQFRDIHCVRATEASWFDKLAKAVSEKPS